MTVLRGKQPSRSFYRALFHAAVVGLFVATTGVVQAQPTRSHRDAAIALGEEGLKLLDRGEHAAALAKFEAANDLVPAPTFGVRAALCLEYLGRLVEALERYEKAASMQIDPSWPEIHTKAQAEARQRAADLRKRVARLYVVLRGDAPENATVELDGRDLAYADLASAVLLNPGEHTVEVVFADRLERREFRVGEGDQHKEEFKLVSLGIDQPSRASTQRTLGWVSVGVGAAGIAFGAFTGLVALNKKGDLDSRCPDHVCPPDAWSDNESYYSWRNASTAGFAIGAVSLGAGTVLLLTDSKDSRETDRAGLEAWVGAGRAGVRGKF